MLISGISSSPVLQWLQNSLSTAGLTVGNQSSDASCDFQSGTISLFQQALQVMTNQTAQPTDAQQSPSVNGTQGHHHHHRHHSEEQSNDPENRSFIDQLAQSILSDLQQTDETSTTDSSSLPNGGGMSFIDGLANVITDNLLAKYQQAPDSSPAPPSTSPPTQVNAIA